MASGIVCYIFSVVMCSTIDVISKLAAASVNPIQMAFWRYFLGGLVCLPIALFSLKKNKIRLTAQYVLPCMLPGLLVVVLSTSFYQLAIKTGHASIVSILYCCNPIFVAVMARIMIRERITKSVVASSALFLAAIIIILISQTDTNTIISSILTLLASILLGAYNVLGQKWIDRYSPSVYVSFAFLAGALELLVIILLSHISFARDLLQGTAFDVLADVPLVTNLTRRSVLFILYLGIVATGISFLSMQIATQHLSAITTSTIFYFKLIISPLLAYAVLKEKISSVMIIAMIIIFAALVLKSLLSKKERLKQN